MLRRFRVFAMSLFLCTIFTFLLVWIISRLPLDPVVELPVERNNTILPENSIVQVLMENGEVLNVDTQEYVLRVVLAEMPAEFHLEALKAQAVLARTYALKNMASLAKHNNAAVCTLSTCCQAYYDRELNDDIFTNKVRNAVKETEGLVLKYDNELIEATYFSCSGGMTENAEDVWGESVPYLISKASNGEETSEHYVSSVTCSKTDLVSKLGLETDNLEIRNIAYTDGGGVAEIQIGEQQFAGTQVRELLGLKSTAFHIRIIGDDVIITTKGYGHRVGMSQYGAEAMATDGYTFKEILSYYFSGTKLKKEMR